MQINPQDFRTESSHIVGNWGISSTVRVVITHVPTGLESVCNFSGSMHRARQLAYESLLKRLETNTDYYKQMELF